MYEPFFKPLVWAAVILQITFAEILVCSAAEFPEIPGKNISLLYRVFADKTELPVHSEITGNRVIETVAVPWRGPVNLQILVRESFSELKIRPLRYELSKKAKRQFVPPNRVRIELQLSSPGYYVVEPNGLPPLVLMCVKNDNDLPDPKDPNVIYFGPGIHEPGRIRVKSNQTVFLDAGAKVYGTIEGSCVENVRVTGRGHLYGSKHTNWEQRTYGLIFDRCRNITIEKIGIRDCYWWTTNFVLCDNLTIRDINILSFNKNNGGLMIDSCSNLVAQDSLLMCRDDCICPHALNAAGNGEAVSDNLLFENMVLYNTIDGNGIRIGASLETSEVRNWTFRNIDIVHRAGAAVYSDHSDWATVRNLTFENIVDEATTGNSINMFIDKTRYSCQTGYRNERGNFDGLYFKNYRSYGGKIVLKGFDAEHAFRNVVFAGCTVGGKPVRKPSEIETNRFVYDLRFLASAKDLKTVPLHTKTPASSAPASSPAEIIIDDSDKQFRSYGFSQQTAPADSYQRTASVGKVIDKFGQYAAAIYEPKIAGRYAIYVYWGTHADKDQKAPWIIQHRNGYARHYVDQNRSPGWHALGTYDLTPESNVRLVYPNYFEPTQLPVVADAVKFVPAAAEASPSATKPR